MKTRTILSSLVLYFVVAAPCLAQNPHMGTWKLNESKSKIPAGAVKNTTVVYEAAGDQVKVSTDGMDTNGKPTHTEWTGKFDGKPYPVTGDSSLDTRTYKVVDNHKMMLSNKKGDTVVSSGSIVVSPDGKSRTLSTTGTDSAGKKVSSVAVYDKQ
jgi:hypothetical protein